MQIIMENWNRAVLREELMDNRLYVEAVLGLPLLDSNRALILQEQLLLEGFFDKWKDVAGGLRDLFKAVGDLVSNSNMIGNYMAFIEKSISEKTQSIKSALNKTISVINNQAASNIIATFKSSINALIQKYDALSDGWKKGVIGLGLVTMTNKALEIIEDFDPASIAKDAGADAIKEALMEQLLDPIKTLIGEEVISFLTSAIDGGVVAYARKLEQIVGTANEILKPLKPVLDLIKKGGISTFRRSSAKLTLQEIVI